MNRERDRHEGSEIATEETGGGIDVLRSADLDEGALERAAEEAFAAERELPTTGLLSFYDRLRKRILRGIERKGGKLGAGTVKLLLVAPDVFMLLVRLALDKDVPSSSRALIGGALAYFVLPFDLMPEALLGVGAYVDDLMLAAAVLAHAFSGDLEPYVRKHWSGPENLRVVLQDVASVSRSLLGENLYERLRSLLARRGVEVEDGPAEDDADALDDEIFDGDLARP